MSDPKRDDADQEKPGRDSKKPDAHIDGSIRSNPSGEAKPELPASRKKTADEASHDGNVEPDADGRLEKT